MWGLDWCPIHADDRAGEYHPPSVRLVSGAKTRTKPVRSNSISRWARFPPNLTLLTSGRKSAARHIPASKSGPWHPVKKLAKEREAALPRQTLGCSSAKWCSALTRGQLMS